jgi:hypothetical protein
VEQAGFKVLLLDNCDVGGSTRFDEWGEPRLWWQFLKNKLGFEVDAPYTLNDMAAETVALMDQLLQITDSSDFLNKGCERHSTPGINRFGIHAGTIISGNPRKGLLKCPLLPAVHSPRG